MQSWVVPTEPQIDKALAQLKSSELSRYFYSKLENPLWFLPLVKKGMFLKPPVPVFDENGNEVYPRWHIFDYFVRVSGHPENRAESLRLIKKLQKTQHIQIHNLIFDILLKLDSEDIHSVVESECRWIEQQDSMVGYKAQKMIELALAVNDMRIVKIVFNTVFNVKFKKLEYETIEDHQIVVKTSSYDYGRLLNKFVGKVRQEFLEGIFPLLSKILNISLAFSGERGEKQYIDHSYIWLPSVEEHPQNEYYQVSSYVAKALRDCCIRLIKGNSLDLNQIVKKLEEKQPAIFKRLAIYLVTEFHKNAGDLISRYLLSRENLDDINIHHEMFNLIAKGYVTLSEEEQEEWLEVLKCKQLEYEKGPLAEGKNSDEVKIWIFKRLYMARNDLKGESLEIYNRCRDFFGELDHPDFPVWSTSGWTRRGDISPISSDKLGAMRLSRIIEYISSFKPVMKNWEDDLTHEGLATVLKRVVSEQPDKFTTSELIHVINLHPIYICEIFNGIVESAKKGVKIKWQYVLELAFWTSVFSGAQSDKKDKDRESYEGNWHCCRMQIARMLCDSISHGNEFIPFSLREKVWEIVCLLHDDPEPDLEYETTYGGDNMSPYTMAINTVRPKVLELAIIYCLWVMRNLGNDRKKRRSSFKDYPEVLNLVNDHLNDNCQSIKAIYGHWLPHLTLIDQSWVKANKTKIFPETNKLLSDASWATYVTYAGAYDNVYKAIADVYKRYIGEKVDSDFKHSYRDAESSLAIHIAIFIARDVIRTDEELFDCFVMSSSDDVLSDFISFIGNRSKKERLQLKIINYFKCAVLKVVEHALNNKSKYIKTCKSFGSVFASDMFPVMWTYEFMMKILKVGVCPDGDYYMFARFLQIKDKYPLETLNMLELLIENQKEYWEIISWEENLKILFEHFQTAADRKIAKKLNSVLEILGKKGFMQYGTYRIKDNKTN